MELWDVHTHQEKKNAIINSASIMEFYPKEGFLYSVGIHPWQAAEVVPEVWQKLEELIYHPQVVAIGEVGLDKLKGPDLTIQTEIFGKQIELAQRVGKPLLLHAVRSTNEIVQLKKQDSSGVSWIIHGFRGNKNMAQELIKHGFYLSFGDRYDEESLKNTPLDQLFAETDEGKMAISSVYAHITATLSVSAEELEKQIIKNIRDVFLVGKLLFVKTKSRTFVTKQKYKQNS